MRCYREPAPGGLIGHVVLHCSRAVNGAGHLKGRFRSREESTHDLGAERRVPMTHSGSNAQAAASSFDQRHPDFSENINKPNLTDTLL